MEVSRFLTNEQGLDANHNPEFTTCEFYKAYASLNDLVNLTQNLVHEIYKKVRLIASKRDVTLKAPDIEAAPRFRQLEFVPTIEASIREPLPNLSSPNAKKELLAIFDKHEIPMPANPTLPRLLDKLSSEFIEPHCQAPTFITHHPECLAPLAKSFLEPSTRQHVAASAELFMKGLEIANMYEEENSPFEQRRKFKEALKYNEQADGAPKKSEINESYIEALEWGLPPTGGWGCGIDRLVMLFTGASRIGDVLTFGTLRNVVNLGSAAKLAKIPDQPAEKDEA